VEVFEAQIYSQQASPPQPGGGYESRPHARPHDAGVSFDKYDVNGDGVIDRQEWINATAASPAAATPPTGAVDFSRLEVEAGYGSRQEEALSRATALLARQLAQGKTVPVHPEYAPSGGSDGCPVLASGYRDSVHQPHPGESPYCRHYSALAASYEGGREERISRMAADMAAGRLSVQPNQSASQIQSRYTPTGVEPGDILATHSAQVGVMPEPPPVVTKPGGGGIVAGIKNAAASAVGSFLGGLLNAK